MTRVSRSLGALALAVIFGCVTAGQAQAEAPMVLLLHGGGWKSGDPRSMTTHRDELAADGYRTRIVAYPLGSVTASIDYVDAVAQRERVLGGPVIAYGISAGGTIAAALAAAGRVDGSIDVIGPTNFTTWLSPSGLAIMLLAKMSAAEKVSASPYFRLNARQSPQLLQCGLLDVVTTYDQCTNYTAQAQRGNPDTTLQTMLNTHTQSSADRALARAWIRARWPRALSAGKARARGGANTSSLARSKPARKPARRG